MWALSSVRRRKEGKMKTGPHPEFSLGERGDDSESICNLCLILKIML
jgi:hypothetical protein